MLSERVGSSPTDDVLIYLAFLFEHVSCGKFPSFAPENQPCGGLIAADVAIFAHPLCRVSSIWHWLARAPIPLAPSCTGRVFCIQLLHYMGQMCIGPTSD